MPAEMAPIDHFGIAALICRRVISSEVRSFLGNHLHWFHAIEIIAVLLMALLIVLILFEPPLRYVVKAPKAPLESDEFVRLLGILADAEVHRVRKVDVLTNAGAYYPAALEAIGRAKKSVHLEAFIFDTSDIARKFVEALAERAAAGVKVRVVVDAVGSFLTPSSFFDPIRRAGGRMCWYQPLRWYLLKHWNTRSHRKVIVVDGEVAFIGGADIGEHWATGKKGLPPWRDTSCRVEGPLVVGLQTAFAENWLESSDEILTEDEAFQPCDVDDTTGAANSYAAGMVVVSSPTPGRSTRSRVLYQLLLASSKESIDITTAYFLPDRSARRELIRAVRDRKMRVRVLVPGRYNNHRLTRLASRRRYGPLLEAGVEIYEYQPGMIHAKLMVVDRRWCVVGSTNFDSRSFDLNEEINMAVTDPSVAERLGNDFATDLSKSVQITYEAWRKRSLIERVAAQIARIFERQE